MLEAIEVKWLALGGASSFLGAFTGSCAACPDGRGAYAHFAGGGDDSLAPGRGGLRNAWGDS